MAEPDADRGDRSATEDGGGRGGGRVRLPRHFGRNIVTTYLKTGSTAVVSLVMTPVLVVGLGKEAFGVWVVATSLGVFRDLLQLGVGNATPKYVAETEAVGDREGVLTSIATSFWILAALGTVALALGLGMAAVFPDLFSLPSDLRSPAQVLVVLMAIDFAISMPANAFTGTLIGLQRYDLVNGTQILIVLVQAAGWAIALALGGGLVALGAIGLGLTVVGAFARYWISRRLVPGLSVSPSRADRGLARRFAGFSIWLGIEDVAYVTINRVDAIIVGLVLGVAPAGVYGVGQRLAVALGQLVQPLAYLFLPHSSELAAKGDRAGLRASLLTGIRLAAGVAAPLALTLAILAAPIIDTWVGGGFEGAASVTVFLVSAITVWVLIDTGVVMLKGMGIARGPAIIRLCEAVLNVCLSVLLAKLIGLEGVALATLVTAVAMNLLILLPYVCRRFDLQVSDVVRPVLVAHGPAAAAALIVGWLVTRADPGGVLALAAAAAAILASYLVVLCFTGLTSRERRALIARILPGARWRSGPDVPPA